MFLKNWITPCFFFECFNELCGYFYNPPGKICRWYALNCAELGSTIPCFKSSLLLLYLNSKQCSSLFIATPLLLVLINNPDTHIQVFLMLLNSQDLSFYSLVVLFVANGLTYCTKSPWINPSAWWNYTLKIRYTRLCFRFLTSPHWRKPLGNIQEPLGTVT